MSNSAVPNEILRALLSAPEDRQLAALRVLRGDRVSLHDETPLLYTVSQSARRLNMSRSSVWRAIRAGRLKKIEVFPGCERIRRADLEALAEGI